MQAQLPALVWLLAGLLIGVLAIWGGWRMPSGCPAILFKTVAGLLIGFAWAGLSASHYLAEELDASLEGQDLIVVGVVDSLPFRFDQGVRFNLRVESATRDGVPVAVPARVALGWYAGLHFPRKAAAALPVPPPILSRSAPTPPRMVSSPAPPVNTSLPVFPLSVTEEAEVEALTVELIPTPAVAVAPS